MPVYPILSFGQSSSPINASTCHVIVNVCINFTFLHLFSCHCRNTLCTVLFWPVYPVCVYSPSTAAIPYTIHCHVTWYTQHTDLLSMPFYPVYSPIISSIPHTPCCQYPVYCPVISGIPNILCLPPDSSQVWLSHSLTLTSLFSRGLTDPKATSFPSHSTQHLLAEKIVAALKISLEICQSLKYLSTCQLLT